MTAEVAVMNKSAVALAADSAVTFNVNGGQKVYETVNKVFSLSKYHPVGLMVYGKAEFMGIDWETIVKIYRSRSANRAFDTLGEHAQDFLGFLENDRQLFDDTAQNTFVEQAVGIEFLSIRDRFLKDARQELDQSGLITSADIQDKFRTIVTRRRSILSELNDIKKLVDGMTLSSIEHRKIRDKYKKTVRRLRDEVFQKLPVDSGISRKLNEIAFHVLTKEGVSGAGVVVAGYGKRDIFPVLEAFHVEFIFRDTLKFHHCQSCAIGRDISAAIVPFAQSEMVSSFMEGVDPYYQSFIDRIFRKMLNSYSSTLLDLLAPESIVTRNLYEQAISEATGKLAQNFENQMTEYRNSRFIQPVIDIVRRLPKSELAAMAESLVNLTSFRRHVTPDAETVGGPIDVAIISRGDGFIWIKRKHYFQPQLNQHFLANYFREVSSGEREADE